MTRLVLFGAGASFGSGDVQPRTPPLGADLFTALQKLYPTWRSIPENAAVAFSEDFEGGMHRVIEHYGFAIGPLMQEMAIFFSIFGIPQDGDNRYVNLLHSLAGQSDIVWSTLNYDCLLESAASRLDRAIAYFNDPMRDDSTVPIWKLHGSCNFRVGNIKATRGVKFSGTGVVFEGGIEPIQPSEVKNHYGGNTALYPAMALYAAGKPISMSPRVIQDAQGRWADHVNGSDKVLTIGVNPNPADIHVWDPIAMSPALVGFVGSEDSFNEWLAEYRPKLPSQYLGATWGIAEERVIGFLEE